MQKGYDLSVEDQFFDKKSLRIITGKTADWSEVAKDSVAFANAKGGRISIGIEDKESLPPLGQIVTDELLTQLQTRIAELTVNVTVVVERAEASNQAQFIDLHILRANTLSSTTDGRYYERIGDTTKPILAGDVLRLASDRPAYVWELQTSLQVPRSTIDTAKLNDLHQVRRTQTKKYKKSFLTTTHSTLLRLWKPCGVMCPIFASVTSYPTGSTASTFQHTTKLLCENC
jgi:ATP-dependent DNA helicase RecG